MLLAIGVIPPAALGLDDVSALEPQKLCGLFDGEYRLAGYF